MHDDLDRTGELPTVSSARLAPARLEMLDAAAAITAAERVAGSRVFGDATENGDLTRAAADAAGVAEKGERATLVAPSERLASMREPLRRIARARLALVAHAISGHGGEDLAALADLGWGVLVASGPEDSFDLTLVARRAAEDSGVPFLVVHGLARNGQPGGRALAMVGIPQDRALQSFVGPRARIEGGAPAGGRGPTRNLSGDRAYAERVPFALGSALREYGAVSGRRHDAFDKAPLGESPLVLVGAGPVGDALFCAVPELRARGYEVGAVHITSLRPFPGPRLVKALGRALAITVLEPLDEPFAHGALLARDVKSAFSDALTWMPGFPGIGRIPKLFVGAAGSAFEIADLVAVCENMLADERGRRVFSFSDVEHVLPRVHRTLTTAAGARAEREIALRFVLDDVASAEAVLGLVGSALAAGVGLRTHGILTADGAGAAVVDVVASRDHARGGMARRAPRLVLATEHGVGSALAIAALDDGAVLGVVGVEASGTLPEGARTVARQRRARVIPLGLGGSRGPVAVAAVAAGAALAAASRVLKTPLDAGAAARAVADNVAPPDAELASQRARASFEATRDIFAAATVETDPNRPIGVA